MAAPKTNTIFPPAPEPLSKLGYYRLLSPTAGVRVSPICLGAMNFGTVHRERLGDITKETAFNILDKYYELGGNFIDTANGYQDGQSEQWLGDWMKERGNRDNLVIATKYTSAYIKPDHSAPGKNVVVNFMGNSRKSLFVSVEASLKKLQTHYIDLLYLHWWDYTTSIEEVMQGLNQLVLSGKVLYLGISDAPAWIVTKANQYARDHGLAQFVVYQGKWSILARDLEREVIPMLRHEGMGLAPWGVLGQGLFKTSAEIEASKQPGAEKSRQLRGKGIEEEPVVRVRTALEEVAKRHKTTLSAIANAYVLAKTPYVFPILGGRKVEHLEQNVASLEITLTPEDFKTLEEANPLYVGFPHDMIGFKSADNGILASQARYTWIEETKAPQFA